MDLEHIKNDLHTNQPISFFDFQKQLLSMKTCIHKTNTHTYINAHIHACTYIRTNINSYKHTYIHTYMHLSILTNLHTYARVYFAHVHTS